MKFVWKIELHLQALDKCSSLTIQVPRGSRVVHAEMHQNTDELIYLWIEFSSETDCIPDLAYVPKRYYVFGTGHQIPDSVRHCATVVGSMFVWHVYE